MDEKTTKAEIYENALILDETAEQAIDVDFLLPEYYPDIEKILKCFITAYISAKGTNGNTLLAEGVAVITVLYTDNDNMLNSYEYRYSFSKSFDVSQSGELCTYIEARPDYINCRAVGPRKIDVHGAITVKATGRKRVAREILTDISFDDVEVLRETVSANAPLSCGEKTVDINEDIEIGNAKFDINCIIRYSGHVNIKESRSVAGKVMVKGDLALNILYCNDEGKIDLIKETIPFGQMVETATVTEDCMSDTKASLSGFEIKPKADNDGKLRSFSVDAKILLSVFTYCVEDVSVLIDAYSRKYEIKTEKTEIELRKIAENVNDTFTVKGTVELAGIKKMIDLWCKSVKGEETLENGKLKAKGTLLVGALYFDENDLPVFAERELPYSFERDINLLGENYAEDIAVEVLGCSYLISNENSVDISAEMAAVGSVYEVTKKNVLSELDVDKDKKAQKKSECALLVYFAEKGERLWDIAASHLADLEELKEINDISDDIIKEDKTLLIPMI